MGSKPEIHKSQKEVTESVARSSRSLLFLYSLLVCATSVSRRTMASGDYYAILGV